MNQKLRFLMLALLCAMLNVAWGEDVTLTFVQSSASEGTLTGNDNITATFQNTYQGNNIEQVTKGNSMTLTLSGFSNDKYVKAITLSMKNNAKSGNGTVSVKVGDVQIATLTATGLGGEYKDIPLNVTQTALTNNLVITISCTENSVYCNRFEVTYGDQGTIEKIDPEVSFGISEKSITIGEYFTNTISKPASLNVVYSLGEGGGAIVELINNNGTVKGKAVGSTTVVASWNETNLFNSGSIYYTVNVAKKENTLTVSDVIINVGKSKPLEINKNSDAAIAITPTNSEVASITYDETSSQYIVRGLAVGSETFTATQDATTEYLGATITFTVTVKESDIFYESFNGFTGITGGNDENFNAGTGEYSEDKCDNVGWDVTAPNAALQCIKLGSGKVPGQATTPAINYTGNAILTFKAAAWNNKDDGVTLGLSISNGTLNPTRVTLSKTKWTEFTVNISEMTEGAKITFGPTTDGKNHRFFLDEVRVSRPVSATFNSKYKGFTSIYYSDKNLKVPADVTAYTYKVENGKGEYITTIPAEGVIPAGTPVILEYGKPFTGNVTVTFEEVASADPLNDGNMLRGSDQVDANGLTTGPEAGDYYFYVLSVGQGEEAGKIGFYWKVANGAPFAPTPHKAYLALKQSDVPEANASMVSISDTNGINSITVNNDRSKDVYTLSGIRMNGKDLPKGIYIIGGKKVVVK